MVETEQELDSRGWVRFLKAHWKLVVLFVAGAVLASIGAIIVFLWFVGDAQLTGMVPTGLSLWTMGHLVTFLLHLIFWEILIIGIPVILVAVGGWFWWKRLPDREKADYHFFSSSSRATSGSGGVSLLFSIAYCIKVYLDGNWNVAFATWTFDYLVNSMLWTLIWILIIFGIPIAIAVILWIMYEMKKKCQNHPKKLAEYAKILMKTDEEYTNLLIAIQTGNRVAFETICHTKLGLDPSKKDDFHTILELWAAAVGTMSTDAQAAYPGSSGW